MPQLDIDLFEDFLFFAIISLSFGFGDDESEENAVDLSTDCFLAQYYIFTTKHLFAKKNIVKDLISNALLIK